MYIKSLELTNFQAHEHLQVNFINGINVVVGASKIGKSCIRRAIEWCLFNSKIDGIRREDTKQTSVKIILSNDAILERIRSASINRYILNFNGKESTFDSIGRTIPEEVKDAIGLLPIEVDGEELWLNSAPQIALPFLFDKSPTWRMKLFNKLTGNDVLDKLFVQFNKDILRIGRDHKTDTERFDYLAIELETKEIEKEQLEAIHETVKNQILKLQEIQKIYDNHVELLDLQQKNKEDCMLVSEQKGAIKFPQDTEIERLTIKITNLEAKKTLLNAVLSNAVELSRVSDELSSNTIPELAETELCGKIDRLNMLNTVIKGQNDTKTQQEAVLKRIGDIEIELKDLNKELNVLIDSINECPTCGQDITEECKEGLKL